VDSTSTLLGAGGTISAFVALLSYLLRQYSDDRRRDQRAIALEQQRTADADRRRMEALAAESAAQAMVDAERKLRRAAEAAASLAEGQLELQRTKLAWYVEEVNRLRLYLPPEIRPGVLPDPPQRNGE
jgi:hypothetical protein